jgi:hypothetical protein
MVVGFTLFTLIGAAFAVIGFLMVRNRGDFGSRFVESRIPKIFRIGDVETHRKVLGWAYLVLGSLFAVIGIALLIGDAVG